MEKIYSVEEIQTIEKKEFKKLKSSYVLMKRAGTNCAKKIYKSKKKLKKKIFRKKINTEQIKKNIDFYCNLQ